MNLDKEPQCPACKGRGTLVDLLRWQATDPIAPTVTCDRCDGRGWLKTNDDEETTRDGERKAV